MKNDLSLLFQWLPRGAGVFMFVAAVSAVLSVITVLILSFAVRADVVRREYDQAPVFLVGPNVWFLITLTSGGLLGAFGYWIIHYSALRYYPVRMMEERNSPRPDSSDPAP